MYKSLKQFYTFVLLETPYRGLENSEAGININVNEKIGHISTLLRMHPLDLDVNSTIEGNVFMAKADINFDGKK